MVLWRVLARLLSVSLVTTGLSVVAVVGGPVPVASASTVVSGTGGEFMPATGRLLDTRTHANTAFQSPMQAGSWVPLQVAGQVGLPSSGISAVQLTLTAVNPAASGYISVRPDGSTATAYTSLLFGGTSGVVSNTTIVAVPANGQIDVFAASSTDLLVDVQGYYTTGATAASGYVPSSTPTRIVDTRIGLGLPKAPLTSGTTKTITVAGQAGVPAGASAAFVTFEVVQHTSTSGFLSVAATGSPMSSASLNFPGGVDTAIGNVVPLSDTGQFDVKYSAVTGDTIDLLVDVVGYFAPANSGVAGAGQGAFTPAQTRVVNRVTVAAGATSKFYIAGVAGIPASGRGISAVAANIEVLHAGTNTGGPVSAYPDDGPGGSGSGNVVMLLAPNSDRSNLATVALGSDGGIDIHNGSPDSWQLYIDVEGWYTNAPNALVINGQNLTQQSVGLQAQPNGSNPVTYEYRLGTTATFASVPVANLTDSNGGHPLGWPMNLSGGSFPAYTWNIAATLGNSTTNGLVQVEACYGTGSSPVCAAPSDINYTPADFGSGSAAAAVGPGSVSLLTGDYQVGATDAGAASSLGGLSIGRSHTSFAPSTPASPAMGVFGPGWTADLSGPDAGQADLSVVDTHTAGWLGFTSATGSETMFEATSPSNVYPITFAPTGDDASSGVSVQMINATTIQWFDPDGTITTWTQQGGGFVPISVQEPGSSSTTSYTYNGAGLVTRILAPVPAGVSCSAPDTTPGCRSLVLTYSTVAGGQRLTSAAASLPQTSGTPNQVTIAHYDYTPGGLLQDEYDPRLTTPLKTTYGYDGTNRLNAVTPPGQATYTLGYDNQGRLATVSRPVPVTDPSTGAITTQTATSTVAYGVPLSGSGLPDVTASTAATWNQNTDLPVTGTAIFTPDHQPSSTPSSGDWPYASIHYQDVNGREVNTAGYGNGAWQIDTTQFDTNGNPTWVLAAGNRAQALTPTGSTDPYVASINTGGPNGQSASAVRADLLATQTVYSPLNAAEVTDTYGPTHPVKTTAGATIDARDHTTTAYDEGAPSATNPQTGQPWGLPTTVVSTEDNAQTGNDLGYPDAKTTVLGYGAVGSMSGNLTGITDLSGHSVPFTGWALGQATTSTIQMGTNPSSADLTTTTVYDQSGRTIGTWLPGDSTGTTPRARVTTYYAATGSTCNSPTQAGLVCQTAPGGQPSTGAQLPTTTTVYDQWGDPLTATQAYGGSTVRTVTNTFDAIGRLSTSAVALTGAPADNTALPSITNTYDPATGALAATTAGTQTLSQSLNTAGSVSSYTDATGAQTTTGYDIDGRLTWRSDPKGQVAWTYDNTGEHRGVVTGETFDPLGHMPSVPSQFTVAYDNAGNPTVTYPNSLISTGTWDNTGTQTSLSYTMNGSTWFTDQNTAGSGGKIAAHASTLNESAYSAQGYSYDQAGRLVTVQDTVTATGTGSPTGCTTRSYQFDSHGNRQSLTSNAPGSGGACSTSSTATTTNYTVDQADRLTSDTTGGNGYVYDALGRTSTLPAGDATGIAGHSTISGDATIGYFSNDMVASQSQGGTSIAFTLDPSQNRINTQAETNTGGTTTLTNHYDDGTDSPAWAATTKPDNSTTWSRNVQGPDGGLAVLVGSDGSVTLQLTNLHGDVVSTVPDTTSATGSNFASAYHETTEYGVPRAAATASNPYGYLGAAQRSNNDLAGLTLMGVRLYDAGTGRFLSTDPIYGGNDNAYNYPNDPIGGADASGRNYIENVGGGGSEGRPEGEGDGGGSGSGSAEHGGDSGPEPPEALGRDAVIAEVLAEAPDGQMTTPLLERIARSMGFRKTPFHVHGEAVFQKGRTYISHDNTSHNGGFWKVAYDDYRRLGSRRTRHATFSIDLERMVGK